MGVGGGEWGSVGMGARFSKAHKQWVQGGAEPIEKSKQNDLSKLGAKLADNCTGQKTSEDSK